MLLFRYIETQVRVLVTAIVLALVLLVPIAGMFSVQRVQAAQSRNIVTQLQPTPILGDAHELEAFLDGLLNSQLKENHIPGATLSIVKDGKLLLAKGYGDANVERHTPVAADTTLFRVGSISKMFTWTSIMQLAEAGKVDLHTDINTYLKTFKVPNTYPQPITLENLLTHTAGFEDSADGIFVKNSSSLTPLNTWLPAHMPARIYPPGQVTAYSNYGATLAGYIVEQVSGMPYDQYVQQHLFQPLNMQHSSFLQPLPLDLEAKLAQGYTYAAGAYTAEPVENVEIAPAGSLSTTATDMANFMIAHLQLGRFGNARILQEATALNMQKQHFANDPNVDGMAYGFWIQSLNGQKIIQHGGDTVFMHSLMSLLPAQNVGIFLSFNSDGGASVRNAVLQAFLDRYFPASTPEAVPTKPLVGYEDRVSQIVGTYWSTRRNDTTYQKIFNLSSIATVSDKGNGHILLGGRDAVEIKPWTFREVLREQETFVFRSDAEGIHLFVSDDPIAGFTKNTWYETPQFQIVLLVVSLLFFLVTFLRGPVHLVRAILAKRHGKPLTKGVRSVSTLWLGWIISVLNLIFIMGLILLFTGDQAAIAFSKPPVLTTFTVIAMIAGFLAIVLLVFSILLWGVRSVSWGARIYYTLFTLVAIAFVIDIAFWNLLNLSF